MMLGLVYPGLYWPDWPDDEPVDGTGTRLSQLFVEVLSQRSAATAVSQFAVEVFVAQAASTRATQLAVELFTPLGVPASVTHAAVELFRAEHGQAALTQVLVELFVRLGPCVDGGFPIDPVVPGGGCQLGAPEAGVEGPLRAPRPPVIVVRDPPTPGGACLAPLPEAQED